MRLGGLAQEAHLPQVRDRVRNDALRELRSAGAVLIMDNTGFLKKGKHSAGVKRQYSGTSGRIENSQVRVFLCYSSDKGAALVNSELYIPQEWIADRERAEEKLSPRKCGSSYRTAPSAHRGGMARVARH